MVGKIFEIISNNFGNIKADPGTYIAVFVLGALGAWFLSSNFNGATISAKDATIETLNSQINIYKDKLNGQSPDEVRSRIEYLETKLAQLEPRRLTLAQRQSIIANARPPAGLTYSLEIAEEGPCIDCNRYAADLASALKENGGWEIRQPTIMIGIGVKSPKGIALKVPDPARLPDAGAVLAATLRAANIPFDILPNDPRDRNTEVQLLVSARIVSP